jgi:antitoxin (DNA-binding transcriptional repressor) of toxin-antitoxin stability system
MFRVRTVTDEEFCDDSDAILDAVEAGEPVNVSRDGRIVAVLSPPDAAADGPLRPGESRLDRLIAEGRARPATRPASDLANIKPKMGSMTTKEIIDDIRGPW